MTRRVLILILAISTSAFLATWSANGDDKKPAAEAKTPVKHAGLEKIKALAGDWVLADKPNDPAYCSYRVVSGGTAVMEDLQPSAENMITMYHLDGDALVLTHYCGLGNQPRMKAKPAMGNKIEFEFAGGCNVDPKGKYMSALTLEFIALDHVKAHWTLTDNGKKAEQATFDLIRKKKA